MKIRNGFVSNSSSSSFLVAFKKRPRTVQDVRDVLFPDGQSELHYYDNWMKVEEVCKTVLSDIKGHRSLKTKRILGDRLREGWFDGYKGLPGIVDWNWEDSQKLREEAHAKPESDKRRFDKVHADQKRERDENKLRSEAIGQKFLDENLDAYIFEFEYCDNDGSYGAIMEHGGTFDKVPHITISKH